MQEQLLNNFKRKLDKLVSVLETITKKSLFSTDLVMNSAKIALTYYSTLIIIKFMIIV